MAILQSCCCWRSVRRGSFASGIYTAVSVRVNDIHVCGGSIISPIYILTAAQCPFFSTDSANLTILSVQWGTLKINQSHDYTVIPVLRTIVHPNYNDETFENDIAILQLVQHITFGRNVKAVTLPAKNQKLPDMNGILAGWGDIDGNQTTSELYWAMTPVLASRQSCQKILSNETIYSCNICYGNVNDNIGQCVGDTGGPFTMKLRDEDDYLVGILSWFMVPCGSDPGVLTEVSQYRDWITDETGILYFTLTMVMMATFLHEERHYLNNEREKPMGASFLEPDTISPTTMLFSIIVLGCSVCGLLSSLLLIYGLYKDIRFFLVPWICNVLVFILIDLSHALYIFILETLRFNPITAILFTMDFFLLSLNIYALLCVMSQYQEYKAGRGTANHQQFQGIPNVEYTAPSTATSCSGVRKAMAGGAIGAGSSSLDTRPTPTQSPTTAVNTSLCTNLDNFQDDITQPTMLSLSSTTLSSSSRRPSKKHVQFPDRDNENDTKSNDEPWTVDIGLPMHYLNNVENKISA